MEKTFKITGKPISVAKLKIEGLDKLTYNGTAQTPVLTVSYKEGGDMIPMTAGTDYKLTYENSTNAETRPASPLPG